MQHLDIEIGIEIGETLRPRRSGMARYAASLFAALTEGQHEFPVIPWAPWRRVLGGMLLDGLPKPRYFGRAPPRRIPDLMHATACRFPPWKSRVEIATVHDLYGMPAPEQLSPAMAQRLDYIYRADRLIAVSEFTRKHLHELLRIPKERIVAIPLAPASHFVPASETARRALREKFDLPEAFLLFAGRDRINKNLDRLVQALAQSGLRLPLCFAGRQSRATQTRLTELARGGCAPLKWLGEVNDRDLPALLSCASALCMPSTFEGFGLPVVEAMACGTAVLTSANCATEEAAGGYAVLVDPLDLASIAEGLHRVLKVSDTQREAARQYATHRTWRDIATATVHVYREALGLSPAQRLDSAMACSD